MKPGIRTSIVACVIVCVTTVCGCGGGDDSSGGGASSLESVARSVVAGTPSADAAGVLAGTVPHLVYPSSYFHGFQTMSGDSAWVDGEERGIVDSVTALPIAWVATSVEDMQYAVGVVETHEHTGRMVTYRGVGTLELLRTIVDITFYDARSAAVVGTVRVTGDSAPFTVTYNQSSPPSTVSALVDYDDVINAMRPFVEQ